VNEDTQERKPAHITGAKQLAILLEAIGSDLRVKAIEPIQAQHAARAHATTLAAIALALRS
jgi:hypothetical protein